MKNKRRAEEMAQLLEAQKASGLSKKAYCEHHGIAPSLFYYWQKRLSQAWENEARGFTQLTVQAPPPGELELRLPGGHWVGVRAHSASGLRLLLEAISQAHA